MQNATCAQDVHLSHSIQRRSEADRVLLGLGDQLNSAILVAWHAPRLRELAHAHQEGCAHLFPEFPRLLEYVLAEGIAVPVAYTPSASRLRAHRIGCAEHYSLKDKDTAKYHPGDCKFCL